MRAIRPIVTVAFATAVLVACADDQPILAPTQEGAPPPAAAVTALDKIFDQAALEFDVPAQLLKAIGLVETRWQMVQGTEEFPGQDPAFGIMALRGERLEVGARLAGVSSDAARTDKTANIRAAAALLSSYAVELGLVRADLGAWAPAVARYSGISALDGQAAYVHNDVYAALREGAVAVAPSGVSATIVPVRVEAAFPRAQTSSALACAPDYCVSGSVWRPSPNYSSRSGYSGDFVIIHSCEGSYTSCWSWLTNSSAQASAHYVVKEDGSEISQLVRESNKAWHIAADYNCDYNYSYYCSRNGLGSNYFTQGIEHGGYASQTSWPESQINASAKLVCNITADNGIPRHQYRIVSHARLQPWNRTDPGSGWPWGPYIRKINYYCGSRVVDTNNNNNDSNWGNFAASSNWTGSSYTPRWWGGGYWYASAAAVSDAATFSFYLPAAATKTVYAWWTSGSNRSTATPFIAFDANGTKLGTVHKDQTVNGSQWNSLGSYAFTAGWNKILVSRWTTASGAVIADAIRVD